jgi:riboflavin synthase
VFTGIIERTLRVTSVTESVGARRLTLACGWGDVQHGESIAVNGCCLTVADQTPGEVAFDVVAETLEKTNLGLLRTGDEVHVERSLRIGDRLSGHFVQGHVDGTAKLIGRLSTAGEHRLRLESPGELVKFISPKGSVCLDGVSLTVAAIDGDRFEVVLIPTTLEITVLGRRPIGWPMNLETDILSKTIISYLELNRR